MSNDIKQARRIRRNRAAVQAAYLISLSEKRSKKAGKTNVIRNMESKGFSLVDPSKPGLLGWERVI